MHVDQLLTDRAGLPGARVANRHINVAERTDRRIYVQQPLIAPPRAMLRPSGFRLSALG
jgi:hypothetical protein